MKICPKCHTVYADSEKFCARCGTPLEQMRDPEDGTEDFFDYRKKEKKKKSFAPAIVVGAVCGLCAFGIVMHMGMRNSSGSSSVNTVQEPPSGTVRVSADTQQEEVQAAATGNSSEQKTVVVSTQNTESQEQKTSSEQSHDYILEGSDSRYITADELSNMSGEELTLARNEIFARHGRKFQDAAIQAYFNSKDWYTPSIEPDDFDYDTMLNKYEKANIKVIQNTEAKISGGSNSTENSNQPSDDDDDYCRNLSDRYVYFTVAMSDGNKPVDKGDYYELTVNVYDANDYTVVGYVVGTVKVRIRKDAQVLWSDGYEESLISLDEYAGKYNAQSYVDSEYTRIWHGSDEYSPEGQKYRTYYDENGYITQFYDGEFA